MSKCNYLPLIIRLRDDVIAAKLHTIPRESNRLLARLREDRLIRCESKNEKDSNKPSKTFYFIDFKQLVDVVKFKIYRMKQIISASLNNVALPLILLGWRQGI